MKALRSPHRLPTWVIGLTPLALLAVLIVFFLAYGPLGVFHAAFPPVEDLAITRVTFPDEATMVVTLVNGGPAPATVAQVTIDEAYRQYKIAPGHRLPRFGRATVTIPYPWVAGAQHEVAVVTSTGLTFTHTVAVATRTPQITARYLAIFALLGFYAAVAPVFIGLCWFPFLGRIPPQGVNFCWPLPWVCWCSSASTPWRKRCRPRRGCREHTRGPRS